MLINAMNVTADFAFNVCDTCPGLLAGLLVPNAWAARSGDTWEFNAENTVVYLF